MVVALKKERMWENEEKGGQRKEKEEGMFMPHIRMSYIT